MSVDKFGRFNQINKSIQGPPGPRGLHGKGFIVSLNGDYNIQGKRLFNLKDPVENKDAVTKMFVDTELKKIKDAHTDLINSLKYVDVKMEKLLLTMNESNKKFGSSVIEYMNTNLDLLYRKVCEIVGQKIIMKTRSPWAPSLPGSHDS